MNCPYATEHNGMKIACRVCEVCRHTDDPQDALPAWNSPSTGHFWSAMTRLGLAAETKKKVVKLATELANERKQA